MSTMVSTNPAALQGWIKSIDPKSGRVFFANHITRKTQWETPEGWQEEEAIRMNNASRDDSFRGTSTFSQVDDKNDPLPSNWEVMYDPTTGKPFYIDHERKITTWTRPKVEKAATSMSLRPATAASPSSGNSSALARILQQQRQQQQQTSSVRRSYQEEAAYFHGSHISSSIDSDLSDSLPKLDFSVKKVPDSLRPVCPSCKSLFTISKRRHHCRLCGDVFCDACSNHRCTLPLDGPEFDKPVRVCDFCFKDIETGNFFSVRRYLTVLHLVDPTKPDIKVGDDEAGVATRANVNAALSGLCQDLQQMVQAGDTSLHEKVKIPPEILVPEILKHLKHRDTADRAICCTASLVALESLAGDQKADFTTAIYMYGSKDSIDDILELLERTGTDRRSLYVQEQAARTLFYLTESRIVAATTRKVSELSNNDEDNEALGDVDSSLDISRAIRALLDHASATQNPNLQRWATACIKNLVLEDERRATMAINDAAAVVASGGKSEKKLRYESCLEDLMKTGGLMILGSLIGADDADIRAHAVGALGATLASTRAVDSSMVALSEMTGGEFGRTTSKDGDIIRAIIAGGGCGSSVSQLLLSAENSVAGMGCSLLSSLVTPLLTDPSASASLSPRYDYRTDQKGCIGACREASVEIATGSCLPALLSLVRENGSRRPLELRSMATVTLAAVVSSIGEMGRSWAQGAYEEGLERTGAPNKLKEAILLLNEEGVVDEALLILQSGSGQSLGSSKETPSSRIREAAGIILGSLTSCSAEAIMTLQNKNILSSLTLSSTDASMTTPSTLRGDGAPRCLGILETVSSVLMFGWQHPSGASNELLDRLIEMIDAGAIPYASRVLTSKIDWDSRDKSVGAMKGRSASCRLLCCLFGIALSNDNGIGMRRLLDAVDADSRSYRGGSDGKQIAPSNIIEAALGCLQTASNQARKIVIGGSHHGHHYQTALMDLVEASLLAVGSMCGSSIAPGGSEGTLITGESFLTSRSDSFVARRKDICNVACDIIVRGSRSGPTLLPTMIVGGFGEGSVLASLRLALAIAQNGTSEQHAKLALSGILVPIGDLLRSALSQGDIYKFSSSLALIRSCGPYITAGQGGGLESVRDSIRIATNVLILPSNPEATVKQIETQETLKAECITALEALSRNASLWSSISTDALPSIVRYLQTSSLISSSQNHRNKKTTCGALRAVLQIVQVPSHAVSAAETGIIEPLCKLLYTEGSISQEDEIPLLSLEILHSIFKNQQARRKARLLESGLIHCVAAAVGKSSTSNPNKPTDSRADVTFIGLEIIHSVLLELEENTPTPVVLQSTNAAQFLNGIASEPKFVRALCSSMLLSTNMVLSRTDTASSGESFYDIPKLYGPPLIMVNEKCAGYSNTHAAAESLLFYTSAYACAIESPSSDSFWKTFLLQDASVCAEVDECSRTTATMAAHFLSLMANDHTSFFPTDTSKIDDFTAITRPLVRHRLMEILKDSIADLGEGSVYGTNVDPYITSLLVVFNVPHICLSVWRDPALLDLAFDLIKNIVERDSDEVLHLFVEGKNTIMSLFDLVNLESSCTTSTRVADIRRFFASILGQLAESGLLKDAIERYDVRSSAIAALAAACLNEEQRAPDEDEDMTANKLSAVLMQCLVDLCTVKVDDGAVKSKILLSQVESAAIAKSLGKKLCHMVLSRFLERSKLKLYEMDEEDDIMNAPDIAMLCAIAQHDESLHTLRAIGGLHALSLIAAEGELLALVALQKACKSDADILLEDSTYLSIMNLLSCDENKLWKLDETRRSQLESAAFNLLGSLSNQSKVGRKAIVASDSAVKCTTRASDIVLSLVSGLTKELETKNCENAQKTDNNLQDNDVSLVSDDGSTENSNDMADSSPPHPFPIDTSKQLSEDKVPNENVFHIKALDVDQIQVGTAACSFLASISSSILGKNILSNNNSFLTALSLLAQSSPILDLQFAALNLMMKLGPYVVSDGVLSPNVVRNVAHSVLSSKIKVVSSATVNGYRMKCISVDGLLVIFDKLNDEEQHTSAQVLSSLFLQSVRDLLVTKSTSRNEDRAFVAELAFGISTAFLTIRGKVFVDKIFTQELVTAFVQLIQWRYDPKTNLTGLNQHFLDGCVANCLSLLSSLLWRPDETLKSAGINMAALVSTPLMLARPGKAPRKAIDLLSALNLIMSQCEGTSSVTASRLLERLF